MTLEQQEKIIKELLERGETIGVTSVKLEHGGAGIYATLGVRNVHRRSWIDASSLSLLIDVVSREPVQDGDGRKRFPLYLGQWHCDRELSVFSQGANAEIYTDWQAVPSWREDDLIQDAEAAQNLIQLGPDVVRGWCPGIIDKTEGNMVYVNLARLPWFDGQPATQQTIPVGYQSQRLRLA